MIEDMEFQRDIERTVSKKKLINQKCIFNPLFFSSFLLRQKI